MRTVHKLGTFKFKIQGHDITGWFLKMRKLFNLIMISNYNGDFQTTGDWLKMIIFSLFRK